MSKTDKNLRSIKDHSWIDTCTCVNLVRSWNLNFKFLPGAMFMDYFNMNIFVNCKNDVRSCDLHCSFKWNFVEQKSECYAAYSQQMIICECLYFNVAGKSTICYTITVHHEAFLCYIVSNKNHLIHLVGALKGTSAVVTMTLQMSPSIPQNLQDINL